MKRLFGTLMVLALMLALLPATAMADTVPDGTLMAGQNTPVGIVNVWNDEDTLYVEYEITESGWCITETHLQVATSLDGIPQTKKENPIPGRFEENDKYACESKVEYAYTLQEKGWAACDQQLYIAAHAVVRKADDKRRSTETAWGAGEDFLGRNWATYFKYTVQCEIPEKWPDDGTTTVAFEDLPLGAGNDWDYNDFAVDIDTRATFWGTSTDRDLIQMDFTVRPQAKLAGYTHVMHLGIDALACNGTYELSRDSSLVESGPYIDGTGIDVILVPNTASLPNEVLLSLSFTENCVFSFPVWDQNYYHGENLFFDPYLLVNNTGEDIHRGDVRMLTVPVDWQWPDPDGTRICTAYPSVTNCDPGPPAFVPDWWVTP